MSKKIKKKIHPEDQTEEISDARWEFILRNPKKKRKFDKAIDGICKRTQMSEDHAKRQFIDAHYRRHKAAFDGQYIIDKSYRIYLLRKQKELQVDEDSEPVLQYKQDQREWMTQVLEDSRSILEKLLLSQPVKRRIIVINLERSKEAIMKEVDEIVTNAIEKYLIKWTEWSEDPNQEFPTKIVSRKKERLKWLPIYKELLEVWDLYADAGQQPWQKTFRLIARKVGRPLSTVKDQWYMAYEKIFGEKYTPEIKYSTEEKRGDADKLCANCPYGAKCYRGNNWHPCKDYLAITGKEKNIHFVEYKDSLRYDELQENQDE